MFDDLRILESKVRGDLPISPLVLKEKLGAAAAAIVRRELLAGNGQSPLGQWIRKEARMAEGERFGQSEELIGRIVHQMLSAGPVRARPGGSATHAQLATAY